MAEIDFLKVLLDTSILSGAELAEEVMQEQTIKWGDITHPDEVLCFRKKEYQDASYQAEIDAIPTVGRLIREGRIAAYTYNEIRFEAVRHPPPTREFYALKGCEIKEIAAPIERSKFRKTIDFGKHLAKGGKKDRKEGIGESAFSQIAFVEWLLSLTDSQVQAVVDHSDNFGLSEFERESFHEIDWFRNLCERIGSRENYPDALHIWAAKRNGLKVFLTLEKRLPNIVNQIKQSKNSRHDINISVVRPTALLRAFGVETPDAPPMESGRIYSFMERQE